jgi:hypothetical protein
VIAIFDEHEFLLAVERYFWKVYSMVLLSLWRLKNYEVYISGMLRQPKWGHLRDLHRAIKQAEPALVSGDPTIQSLGNYEKVNVAKNVPT